MRIRSIKPEFWRSPDISCLAIEDRLLFIGLWSYVDDNGVGEDRVPMIAADLFADDIERDPSETFARVSRGLARLSEGGQIIRYTVSGREYFEVSNWKAHQRIDKPGKARLPHHDADGSTIRSSSRESREILAPGTGNREQGTGDQGSSSSLSEVAVATPRPDVEALLDLLDSLIVENGSRKPARNKANTSAMRLLLDKDGYTHEQVAYLIRWSQRDQFWRGNILSASKLREKADTLRLQSQRKEQQRQQSKAEQAWEFVNGGSDGVPGSEAGVRGYLEQ